MNEIVTVFILEPLKWGCAVGLGYCLRMMHQYTKAKKIENALRKQNEK